MCGAGIHFTIENYDGKDLMATHYLTIVSFVNSAETLSGEPKQTKTICQVAIFLKTRNRDK